LAFHLSIALSTQPDGQRRVPIPLVRALAIGPHLALPSGDLARLLEEDFAQFDETWFVESDATWNQAIRCLLAAAALLPALLAPATGAAAILHNLHPREGLESFAALCNAVARYGDLYQPLEPHTLKRAKDSAAWEAELQTIQHETASWLAAAPKYGFIYAPAQAVWRQWFKPGELFDRLLRPVEQNDQEALALLVSEVERLSTDEALNEKVRATDRAIAKRVKFTDIDYRALIQLRNRLREALTLIRRWVQLQQSRPDTTAAYDQQRMLALHSAVAELPARVLDELKVFAASHPSEAIQAAVVCLDQTLCRLTALFDPDRPFTQSEPSIFELLHAELLCVPKVAFDERDEPLPPTGAASAEMIRPLAAMPPRDWPRAFETRCDVEDYDGAQRAIDLLASTPDVDVDLDALRGLRDTRLKASRESLWRIVRLTALNVEQAVAFSLLSEEERAELIAEVEAVEARIDSTERIQPERWVLREVDDTLAERRTAQVEAVRRRLDAIAQQISPMAYERITAVLDRGDIGTANEYIDLAQHKQPLPDAAQAPDMFHSFFPDQLRTLEQELEPLSNRQLVQRIRSRTGIPGIDLHQFGTLQAREAADALQAWFELKEDGKSPGIPSRAQQVLTFLGFDVHSTQVQFVGSRRWLRVDTEPISERDRCPVPAYGSGTKGHYRILLEWSLPTEEDLLHAVGETAQADPVIVFYFGRLSTQRRRDLARLCREKQRTFLVLDDLLLAFLAGVRSNRLSTFFACTLPFTFLEPYVVTASYVPPELFFGRERERNDIFDPMGSCLVYGGRQLGKTALLRDVVRREHAPDRGVLVLWVDLLAEGIPQARTADDIWPLLAKELRATGAFAAAPGQNITSMGPDGFTRLVERWLGGDRRRRILFLLDEADLFLEADGRADYTNLRRLKGLMDRTERRFKVVFAGLHNVQRTARQENHPLAHYGEPICIGPLLNGGEWRDARELVRGPLTSVGNRFESDDLIMRILAQTNYYPSLIQVYCKKLLSQVNDGARSPAAVRRSPPYVISARQIDDVYYSKDLREEIRKRFLWTLQLDPRYEVIAYLLALTALDATDRLAVGFTVQEIRAEATSWWSEGFASTTAEFAFRTLLDEMVGLGVLRATADGRYALRSPNVVSLLGTKREIEQVLDAFIESPPPPPREFEAGTFRSALQTASGSDLARRSPLTAQQESALRVYAHGVSVIVGCQAAGLDALAQFLRPSFEGDRFTLLEASSTFGQFQDDLNVFLQRRQRSTGTSLLLVSQRCPWDERWISEAVERVAALTSRESFVRVAFAADPGIAWRLFERSDNAIEWLERRGINVINLEPWHSASVTQWLDRPGLSRGDQAVLAGELRRVTGYWPELLERFQNLAGPELNAWQEALRKVEEEVNLAVGQPALRNAFGLDISPAASVLQVLAEYGAEATLDELHEFLSGLPVDTAAASLAWADSLCLATRIGGGWRIDPVVGQLLSVRGG
jgi:hypothetical protein